MCVVRVTRGATVVWWTWWTVVGNFMRVMVRGDVAGSIAGELSCVDIKS